MRWLTALAVVSSLMIGTAAFADDDGLGKKGNNGKGGSSSGGSSGGGSGRGGSQSGGNGGGRPERPPVRENNPPPRGGSQSGGNGGGRPDRPPVRENNPPPRGGNQGSGDDLGKKGNGGRGGGGSSNGGSQNGGNGGGRPDHPPVRENNPPRGGRQDDLGKGSNSDRGSGGLGRREDGGRVQIGNGQDRQDLRGRDDFLNRRPIQGRSGQPRYDGNNNLLSSNRVRESKPVEISRLPIDLSKGSLQSQVLREGSPERVHDRGRGGGYNDYNWRSGYCQYDWRWRDNSFCYPYYSFSYSNNCALSPWYYYSNLPAYVVTSRVRFGNFGLDIRWGDSFDWNRYDRYDRYSDNYELGRAVDDIRDAFESGSVRALSYLVPSRGDVYVKLEDGYGYNMNGDDFYDLMVDNITSTRTLRYTITEVKWGSRGEACVLAAHEFTDPWGRRQCVYHKYVLTSDRRGFTIAQFEVRPDRFRW